MKLSATLSVAAILVVGGCGDNATDESAKAVIGTWSCVLDPQSGDTNVIVLTEDGKVTITPQEPERAGAGGQGTWSLDGDTMTFEAEGQEPDTFALADDGGLRGCTKSG